VSAIPDPVAWPDVSRLVWETRYRWGDEVDVGATWRRVARAVAAAEGAARERWTDEFAELLAGFRFLPGGRILAGAGTDRDVTLFNCFVMGPVADSIDGIFDALKEGALTMQRGGGIGYDFSTLRPAGTPARSTGGVASGPVSFMRIWDAMCGTVLATGARRGAMMATLRCDHPDIESFVDAKREAGSLRHFNLSVLVSDEFMAAVRADAPWPLVFPATQGTAPGAALVRRAWSGTPGPVDCAVARVIPARALWERLLRAAWETAEPGVLFVDRINAENNLHWREQLSATNPCGEIPLPAYGACNLGSLNLVRFILDPFEPGARLDLDGLRSATRLAIRFLDDVIDISAFPLPSQAASARATRRLGLGVTGLADALAMLGQSYDAWTARGVAEDILRTVALAAYEASVALAREKGAFPAFEAEPYLAGAFIRRLPAPLREAIARHGIRNSHLLAIAPAGTISLLAGNVSSGIEPVFALDAERALLDADGTPRVHRVRDYAAAFWDARYPGERYPPGLVGATAIGGTAHLQMQACLQPWVDNAISKTINVAADSSWESFRDLYDQAHRRGLKGCTVYRPSALRGAVLTPAGSACCEGGREPD